ncbi:MAG TPA: hypothetical protein VM095_13840 [Pyrinomonadaceae bacterium]|nr:hypothetical protein [Pyrinomonadaceae bacterium]
MSQVDERSKARPEDETGAAVEREIRRRKRLLRLYLMLLIIPVALGIIVLIFGRSDRRLVTDEIQTQASTIVQKEIGEQIKPTIQSEVQNQVAPTLGQIDELKTRQDATAKALREENNYLKYQLHQLNSDVIEKLNKLDAFNDRLIRLERQRFEDRIKKLENRIESLSVRPGVNGFPQKDPNPRVTKTPR